MEEMIDYFLRELRKREVVFQYRTKSGRLRTAMGTWERGLLPPTKGAKHSQVPNLCVYYDTEVRAWRSFYLFNLVSVDLYGEA